MPKICSVLVLLLLLTNKLGAQLHPREGDSLNYRLIAFIVPSGGERKMARSYDAGARYTLQVATGTYDNDSAFNAHIDVTRESKENVIMAKVAQFSTAYTWRVAYKPKNGAVQPGPLRHFTTRRPIETIGGSTRLRVTRSAQKYADAYVMLDHNKSLYDMNGELLWFLPDIKGVTDRASLRDLKISPRNTITFLIDMMAYEINWDGDILWKAPDNGKVNGEKKEYYHHEFSILSNWHYMVMGNQALLCKLPAPENKYELPTICKNQSKPDSASKLYRKLQFGTLIEYGPKGDVLWSWKSAEHYADKRLKDYLKLAGISEYALHDNAFYFDERNKEIYISCKNFSAILKVKYPQGNITAIYGSKFVPGSEAVADTLFCAQHNIMKGADGSLYLFNNNNCNFGEAPKIVKLREPTRKGEGVTKIWEYPCPLEGANTEKAASARITTGGSVYELPDGSIFTSLCSPYASVFIVSPEKEILWSAIPELLSKAEGRWVLLPQYRASIITDPRKIEYVARNTNLHRFE
jgi:hypothetical protein